MLNFCLFISFPSWQYSSLAHFELLLHHFFQKIRAFYVFPHLDSAHFVCTLAKNALRSIVLGLPPLLRLTSDTFGGAPSFNLPNRGFPHRNFLPATPCSSSVVDCDWENQRTKHFAFSGCTLYQLHPCYVKDLMQKQH